MEGEIIHKESTGEGKGRENNKIGVESEFSIKINKKRKLEC